MVPSMPLVRRIVPSKPPPWTISGRPHIETSVGSWIEKSLREADDSGTGITADVKVPNTRDWLISTQPKGASWNGDGLTSIEMT